ncbi:MAG: vanadium-dependent haloperoxidase [Bacteroidota bacterium]|nr:vanadium-dependent haloperoxidase [Bacteroidota bacterium]
MKKLFSSIMVIFLLLGCNSKKDYEVVFKNPDLFCKTVYQLNGVVMGNNFSPIVASRNYLYASVAAYEVIAAGYPGQYSSLAGQVNGLESIPKPDPGGKIDFEFASILAYCRLGSSVTFPEGSMDDYVDSLKKLAKDHGMPKDVFNNSISFSETVSNAVLQWSKKDNYAQTRSSEKYTVTEEPGRWVPTPPAYTSAMEPHWNEIRPVVLDSAGQFPAPPPYKFNVTDSNSDYYKQVMLSKHAIENLTPEQKHIADFWDDNPFKLNVSGHVMFGSKKFSPGGHWMSIVGIAAKKANADFATTVYAYAKTSIALFDAFIECWSVKFKYNTIRPETVINKYFDADWQPRLQTPPFPEYTCGHSTCSSASAEVLTSIFGDNFSYTDSTEIEFGIANRSYKSFRDAALENNMARFYGGIHYHYSCIVANHCGKEVGDLVVDKLKMKL